MKQLIKTCDISISNSSPFVLIGGINVLENMDFNLFVVREYMSVCKELNIPLIFKASYDKANRSSINSYRGPGVKKGIEIFKEIKKNFQIPILTDVHTPQEAQMVS